MTTNREWFERAQRVIPGGVDSPVRSFRSVGGTPYTVVSGSGSRVVDVEGRDYIDYVQSYGASLLGHAASDVIEAIRDQAALGTTFGAPTPGEVLLAEMMVDRVAGMDLVRLVSFWLSAFRHKSCSEGLCRMNFQDCCAMDTVRRALEKMINDR